MNSWALVCAPVTSNARGFAGCVATSADFCLVLDGLERNSTLTRLNLQRGGGRLRLCCRGLLVTLACAIGYMGCYLGNEGCLKVKSVLERNTTLTDLDLSGERVVFCGEGGRGWGKGCQ